MEKRKFEEKVKKLKGPIFIFGASGFIGTNIIETISAFRDDYFAISHDLAVAWRLKLLNLPHKNILHCDITSRLSVENIFKMHNPKTVFNLAAFGAYSKQTDDILIYETNFLGNLNILSACENISCFINAGTSSEYGLNSTAPVEGSELKPNSHYAVSKVSSSYLIEYFAKYNNIPAINLRLYSVYGPWEEPDRLIPRLIENARNKQLPPLVSPEISRDFVYIDDCMESFFDTAINIKPEYYGQSFNVATGKKTTISELVNCTKEEFDIKSEPVWGSMDDRKWDLKEWYGNAEKFTSCFGWKPQTTLKDGLRKTFEWQSENKYEENILPAFNHRQMNKKISCVIACYKDAPAIPIMYDRLIKMFNDAKLRYEIIFVNDNSPDNMDEVLENICRMDSNVISIKHSRNFGSQASFLSGMELSSGDGVVLMDGDLQDPPEIIPQLYAKWMEGYDVVYGIRTKRETSFIMGSAYKLFYRIFKKLSYVNIPVDAGDFSLMDRKVVDQIIKFPETEQLIRGLRAWVGYKQTGVPYVRPERQFGVSTNNLRKNISWAKKAIFSFSFFPIEILSYLGFFLTMLSVAALILQIIMRFLRPDVPQGITTIIVLVLFFGGLQIFAISLLGEYISKIFEESKKRPKFIRSSIRYGKNLLDSAGKIKNFINERYS